MRWHDDVFFGIHYDLHANPKDTTLGSELTAKHLRERLKRVKPDWIQCDCKGHPGWTGWPTKVGSAVPNITRDALRIHRDVTRELGIRLGMHYSGVWDTRALELHPDWSRLNEKGEKDPNQTSRLSSYIDELLIRQMLELVRDYDVDGFWVDGECWASKPDWSPACRAEFTRRTGITEIPTTKGQPHWDAWLRFHRDLFLEHVTKYAAAVHAAKPGCAVCSNWAYTMRMPDPVTVAVDYLSGDFDWAYGAHRAAIEGRILDARRRATGLSWDLMAWGFTKTGAMESPPAWVFKPALNLKQEVAECVALGGAVMIYDQPQRSGWITGWHQDTIAEVADWCRARKAACFQSTSRSEVAVAHLLSHNLAQAAGTHVNQDGPFSAQLFESNAPAVEGAVTALLETHRSTDIILEDVSLDAMRAYKLVVVPEQIRMSDAFRSNLLEFARLGGSVLVTGAHAARDFAELVGAEPDGEPVAVAFLEIDGCAVPVNSGTSQPVKPGKGSAAWAYRLTDQEPKKNRTKQVLATRRKLGRGQIVAVFAPVFNDYHIGHYPLLRRWIGQIVERMKIGFTLRAAPGTSPRLEIVQREKPGKIVLNLLNRGAGETLGSTRNIVEELPPIQDIVLTLETPRRPKRISVVGEKLKIDSKWSRGQLSIRVQQLHIHAAVVVE